MIVEITDLTEILGNLGVARIILFVVLRFLTLSLLALLFALENRIAVQLLLDSLL